MKMDSRKILQLLPSIMARAAGDYSSSGMESESPSLTWVLLHCMEKMHAPAEAAIDEFTEKLDPYSTSSDFVNYLAIWLDLNSLYSQGSSDSLEASREYRDQISFPGGLGRLRELIANATHLSKWRGTKKSLLLFLQIATGQLDFHIIEGHFSIEVYAPAQCKKQHSLIEKIIEQEKPAYVKYKLKYGQPSQAV